MTDLPENFAEQLQGATSASNLTPARPGDLARGQTGGLNAAYFTPEMRAAQEAAHARAVEERERYEAREAQQRDEQRNDMIRASALHAALSLIGQNGDHDYVLAAAGAFYGFLRGDAA